MNMSQSVTETLAPEFDGRSIAVGERDGGAYIDIGRDEVIAVLRFARESLGMNYLTDISAVDALELADDRPERFCVVYLLRNIDTGDELTVRAFVPENDPTIDTATDIWRAADWLEREVYDMFGIEFAGHPNMIRILTPENLEGHPLRKDFPMEGTGHRDSFPVITRDDA
jgi:NADH-quinone oxidoreductase subunit C